MAEILVRALASINSSASEVGDIIVVREDGSVWGKAEGLPEYLIIKLPGISVDTIKKFEQILHDDINKPNPKVVKRRKWNIPKNWVLNKAMLGESVVEIKLSDQKQALIESVLEKTI